MGRLGWILASVILLALVGWSWAVQPTPASAHAILVRSNPAANAELSQPPATLELWFSEPLELTFSRARLLDAAGDELPTGLTTLDPTDPNHMIVALEPLTPGIYTVAWQNLSQADGHPWQGSFPFTVLKADGSRPAAAPVSKTVSTQGQIPSLVAVISRWLVLLGGLLFFGAPLFRLVIGSAGTNLDSESALAVVTLGRAWILQVVWLGALAIIGGSWIQALAQAIQMGGPERLFGLLTETRIGALVLARQILVLIGLDLTRTLAQPWPLRGRERRLTAGLTAGQILLMMFLVLTARYGHLVVAGYTIAVAAVAVMLAYWPGRNTGVDEHRPWRALLALAGAVLLSISGSSHASAGAGMVWAVLGDYIHLLAAAAWLGGLVVLAGLMGQVSRISPRDPLSHLLPLIRRFSYLASLAVFILVITGLFRSLVELPDLTALWQTTYGRVLLIKLLLMLLTLGIAWLNNRLVHAQQRAPRPALWLPKEAMPQQFKRQVIVEAILGLVVMLSVAILVQTPTPRSFSPVANSSQAGLPFSSVTQVDDLYVQLQVTPNQVGVNRFLVRLYHLDGSPVGETQLVRLLFDYRQAPLGQAKADLLPSGPDTFALDGAYLSQVGQWEVSVYIRRRGLDDALAKVSLEVPPPAPAGVTNDPWQNPASNMPSVLLIAVALAAVGVIPFIWRHPLREGWPRLFRPLRLLGLALIIISVIMAAGLVV
jgi:copper transport protein